MISIIVPVYNVEKYLKICIDSIINQTYKNIEIILVDDGSTDNSGKICELYKSKDKRIKVIHKENGGLSSARNEGIKLSNGEYLAFIDSDDFIPSNSINELFEILNTYKADISILKMCNVSENTNELNFNGTDKLIIMDSEKCIENSLYQTHFSCSASSKLFKKELFEDLKFPEGRISEDLAIMHLLFDRANLIVYKDQLGYCYRQQENSIMHCFNEKRIDSLIWALEIEKFCNEKYPNIIKGARTRAFNIAIHLLLDLPDNSTVDKEYYKMIKREINRNRMIVIFDKKARFREKCAAIISLFGDKLLRIVWNSNWAIKNKERK